MIRLARLVVLAAGVALVTGCAGGPAAVEAEGTVTGPDGKALPDILVQFNPDAASGGKVMGSSAVTDAAGRFVLKLDDGRPGAVAGPHRVVLIDNALAAEGEPDGKQPRPRAANRVPRDYTTPTTTPLKVTVEPGKKYDLKIERR